MKLDDPVELYGVLGIAIAVMFVGYFLFELWRS